MGMKLGFLASFSRDFASFLNLDSEVSIELPTPFFFAKRYKLKRTGIY